MASENGWEPSHATPDLLEWVTVPGADVHLQIMKGWPSTIMGAYAADFNAFVEPLRDSDSASFTPTNSVATSNHLNGTAMDLNWDSHPFHVKDTFNATQMQTIRELLAFYEDTIWWGGDWNDPIDEMHWQCGYDTYNNPHTADFIKRKMRADGFSTFRRSDAPAPTPPVLSRADTYALATINEGKRLNITPKGICIALAVELVETNLTMYANLNVPESLNLPHDAVGNDHDSTGTFQQRQAWGPLSSTMDPTLSAGLFFMGGAAGQRGLTDFDYNSDERTPGGWAQAVQVSAFPDRYDARYADAVAIYNRLVNQAPPPQGEDDLSAAAEAMIKDMWDEYQKQKKGPSRSFMAPDSLPVDSPLGFLWNTDGNVWNLTVTFGYLMGTTLSEEFVNKVALDGVAPASWAGQLTNADGRWLAQFGQEWCQGLIALRAAMQKAFKNAGATTVATPAQQPQVVYLPAPTSATAPAVVTSSNGTASTGQLIGNAYDALEQLRLADALPIEGRAPLAALIAVLQTKNGSQLTP